MPDRDNPTPGAAAYSRPRSDTPKNPSKTAAQGLFAAASSLPVERLGQAITDLPRILAGTGDELIDDLAGFDPEDPEYLILHLQGGSDED